jgi:hypothetical protein
MTQAELNAVARATGEDVETIEQRGFSIVGTFPDDAFDFEGAAMPDPQVVDWDSPFVGATQSFYESC